ncbi:MAG: type II 3-dehydroquinate dehydratase [Chloroherpetonaceae bacterium]|nr:type II 3-dehydroquinate dehydratase [Chloroherpetonaceae bacterium]
MKIFVLNGPNLGRLGHREPEIYGTETLLDIEKSLRDSFPQVDILFFQSEYEGALIEKIYEAVDKDKVDAIILNPGALTHYSIALRDAISSIKAPLIEVHLSNVFARESFRAHSVISPVANGVISGFGSYSYHLGVLAAMKAALKVTKPSRLTN